MWLELPSAQSVQLEAQPTPSNKSTEKSEMQNKKQEKDLNADKMVTSIG